MYSFYATAQMRSFCIYIRHPLQYYSYIQVRHDGVSLNRCVSLVILFFFLELKALLNNCTEKPLKNIFKILAPQITSLRVQVIQTTSGSLFKCWSLSLCSKIREKGLYPPLIQTWTSFTITLKTRNMVDPFLMVFSFK